MVIQRWQSILLLVAFVMMTGFSFISLAQVQLPEYTLNFTTLGFTYEGIATDGAPAGYECHTWALFAISLLSALIPFIAIFCFKNMRLQLRLCLIDVLLIISTVATGACVAYTQFGNATIGWSSGAVVAPILALIAVIYAYIRIKSDIRLLRSADRLR